MRATSPPPRPSNSSPERSKPSVLSPGTQATALGSERNSRLAWIVSTACIFSIGLTLVVCEVMLNFVHDAFLNTVVPDNFSLSEPTSASVVQHAPAHALLESLPLADGTLLWSFLSSEPVPNISASIYCVYDPVKANREVVYRLSNIPLPFCTAVVFCCAGISSSNYSFHFYRDGSDDNEPEPTLMYFSEFLSLRLYRKRDYKLFIAIGGPPNRYGELEESMPSSSIVMQNLYRDIVDFGLDGVVLYVLQPELFASPHLLDYFVQSHRGYKYYMLIFLPRSLGEHGKYFNVTSLIEDDYVRFIQVSHPLVTESDYVTCPNPKWTPNNITTMKTIEEDLQRQYSTLWGKLRSRLLFTMSFLGYSFLVQKSTSGHDAATMLDNVTYAEACAAVRSRKWLEKFDWATDCFTASKGGLFMATPGPKSFSFLEEDVALSGVVVFDLYSDDYRGICGIKHPLSQAVHNALVNRVGRNATGVHEE